MLISFIGCWYSRLFLGTISNLVCNIDQTIPDLSTPIVNNDTSVTEMEYESSSPLSTTTLKVERLPTTTTTTTMMPLMTTTLKPTMLELRNFTKIAPIEYLMFPPFSNNGTRAQVNQFPWQTFMSFDGGKKICSGARIGRNTIITTACCLFNLVTKQPFASVSIKDGLINKQNPVDVVHINNLMSHVLIHPKFNLYDTALRYNIALVRAVGNGNMIKLSRGPSRTNSILYASGFGRSNKNLFLKYHLVRVLPSVVCANVYGPAVCHDSIFSTFVANSSRGVMCNLDSGSPITKIQNNKFILEGIASFIARSGCLIGNPDGHVSIPYFYEWINVNII